MADKVRGRRKFTADKGRRQHELFYQVFECLSALSAIVDDPAPDTTTPSVFLGRIRSSYLFVIIVVDKILAKESSLRVDDTVTCGDMGDRRINHLKQETLLGCRDPTQVTHCDSEGFADTCGGVIDKGERQAQELATEGLISLDTSKLLVQAFEASNLCCSDVKEL